SSSIIPSSRRETAGPRSTLPWGHCVRCCHRSSWRASHRRWVRSPRSGRTPMPSLRRSGTTPRPSRACGTRGSCEEDVIRHTSTVPLAPGPSRTEPHQGRGEQDGTRITYDAGCAGLKGLLCMAEKPGWSGRFYEDFEVGDVYQHPLGRTVTTTDNIWFTLLTQNTAPIHFDHYYSADRKSTRLNSS